jgi:predicted DCC family thiol-disulfide oxidoreductase YuxK
MDYKQYKIVLFDGDCVMCSRVVQFLLKQNKQENLYFTSLKSEVATELLKAYKLEKQDLNSVLFKDDLILYSKSEAALQLCKYLNAPYKYLYHLRKINLTLRDKIYTYIASNRYKWFGRKESCLIPTQENKHRFL